MASKSLLLHHQRGAATSSSSSSNSNAPVVITRHAQQVHLQNKLAAQAERDALYRGAPVTEEQRKEEFLEKLGLCSKVALSEIQNKKTERKRRTTANPQFSNAAIEAKRISAMAMAEKRAKRKEAMASVTVEVEPIIRGRGHRERPHLPVFSKSNRDEQRSKTFLQPKSSTSHVDHKPPPKATVSRPTQLPMAVTKVLPVSKNCTVCAEACNPELDVVMFCYDCDCLFHATCASSVEEIVKCQGVPCPRCESKRPLCDEVSLAQMKEGVVTSKWKRMRPAEQIATPSQPAKNATSKPSPSKESSNGNETVTLKKENGLSHSVDIKTHFSAKRKEQGQLVETKIGIEKSWVAKKARVDELKENLKTAREQQARLNNVRAQLNKKVDLLVKFITVVKDGDENGPKKNIPDTPVCPIEDKTSVLKSKAVPPYTPGFVSLTDLGGVSKTYSKANKLPLIVQVVPDLKPPLLVLKVAEPEIKPSKPEMSKESSTNGDEKVTTETNDSLTMETDENQSNTFQLDTSSLANCLLTQN